MGRTLEANQQAEAHLQRAALAAHRRGETWQAFWEAHAAGVQGIDPSRRERLRDTLLHIWATGTPSGQVPPPDPWEMP